MYIYIYVYRGIRSTVGGIRRDDWRRSMVKGRWEKLE